MLRTPQSRHALIGAFLAASFAAFLASGVAACKKDSTAESTSGGGDKSSSSYSGDDLGLLPADAATVISVNAEQILQSGVWKQFGEPLRSGSMGRRINEVKEKCGFDPLDSVKSVTAGFSPPAQGSLNGVLVVHGLDKAKTLPCMEKMKPSNAEVTRDGDIVLVKEGNNTSAMTFVSDNTAVVVVGDKANAAGVKAVLAGNSGLKAVPQFTEAFGKVKASDSLWFVVYGKPLESAAGTLGGKPKAVVGSINVTDGITVDMKLPFESQEVASQVAESLKQKSGLVKAMVDKLDVTAEAAEVKANVAISSQKLQALIANLGSSFGGLFGK